MSDATRPIEPEDLLVQVARLRALARRLVVDDGRADDVVQEAFVAAIERPPRGDVPLGPWLVGVVRNLARRTYRTESRRLRHETAAPRADDAPPSDELAARSETLRDLADAVHRLDPPYRDVVVLHYFDGLPIREVAERLRAPIETVRTRLKRALAMLRARLDDRYGERRAWVTAFGTFADATPRPRGSGAAVSTSAVKAAGAVGRGFLVGTKTVVASAALLLVALGTWWIGAGETADSDTTRRGTSDSVAAMERPAGANVAPVAALHEGTARPARAQSAEERPAERPQTELVYRGTVVEADGGAVIAGARVELFAEGQIGDWVAGPEPAPHGTATCVDGSFEIHVKGEFGPRAFVRATAADHAPLSTFAFPEGWKESPLTAPLERKAAREIVVLAAEDRTPIAGARILFVAVNHAVPCLVATTDAKGLARFASGDDVIAYVAAPGRISMEIPAKTLPRELLLARSARVAGTVLDGKDHPISGATLVVSLRCRTVSQISRRTAEDGRFAFDGLAPGSEVVLCASLPGVPRQNVRAAAGDQDVRIVFGDRVPLRGIVLGADGAPCSGAAVRVRGTAEDHGAVSLTGGDGRFVIPVPITGTLQLEAFAGELRDDRYELRSAASEGRLELTDDARRSTSEPVIRLHPVASSFARLAAVDASGARMTIRSFAARGVTRQSNPNREDASGIHHVAFDVPPGTRVVGRVQPSWTGAFWGPDFPFEVTTSADRDAPVQELTIPACPRLTLSVLGPDGAVLPEAPEQLVLLEEVGFGGCATGQRDTVFRLDPEKRYVVEVRAPGLASARQEFAGEEASARPITLRLGRAARVRGRLIGPDGAAARNAQASSVAGQGFGLAVGEGVFDMPLLRVGEIDVCVMWFPAATTVWRRSFTVAPGEVLDIGDVRLPRIVEVRVRVFSRTGTPIAKAGVTLRPADGIMPWGEATCDDAGTCTFSVATGTTGTLIAAANGYGAAWRKLEPATDASAPVDLTLPAGGGVRLRCVADPAVRRVVNTVAVRTRDGSMSWFPSNERVESRVSDDDVYLLRGLPPGRFIVCTNGQGPPYEGEVEVVAGEVVDLTLR